MLTNIEVRNAKPSSKAYRLYDRDGLYIEVTTTGTKYWRLKYRFGGKEKRLALGVYDAVSLVTAPEKTTKARKQLLNGLPRRAAEIWKAGRGSRYQRLV